MAFEVKEFRTSRGGMKGRLTQDRKLEAVGYGTLDDAEAKAGFEDFFPATYDDLTKGNMNYGTLGGMFWFADCQYNPDDAPIYPQVGITGPPEPVPAAPGLNTILGPDFSFDFNAVQEHITQSKETISKTKRGGGAAPDNQRAIGLTQDGEIKGTDRITGFIEWSRAVSFEGVTLEYVQTVGDMVGKTNNATWYSFPAGTVLFMGGNLQTRDRETAVGQFKFGYSKNLTSIAICDGLTVAAKKGWEYLWVAYKEAQDATKLVQQPDAAYVERIYDSDDFTKLRIG